MFLIAHRPGFARSFYEPNSTAVDTLDSSRILEAYLSKTGRPITLQKAYMSMLFGYVCTNLSPNEATFGDDLSKLLNVTVERASIWFFTTQMHDISLEKWSDFTLSVMDILAIFGQ